MKKTGRSNKFKISNIMSKIERLLPRYRKTYEKNSSIGTALIRKSFMRMSSNQLSSHLC